MIERDEVAAGAGIGATALLQFCFFGMERFVRGVAGLAGKRSLYFTGDVTDLHQLVEFKRGTLPLFGGGLGRETGLDEILVRRGQLLTHRPRSGGWSSPARWEK